VAIAVRSKPNVEEIQQPRRGTKATTMSPSEKTGAEEETSKPDSIHAPPDGSTEKVGESASAGERQFHITAPTSAFLARSRRSSLRARCSRVFIAGVVKPRAALTSTPLRPSKSRITRTSREARSREAIA